MTGFNLLHEDSTSRARAGEIQTDHGLVHTPVFMPVGTSATVKAVHQQELAAVVKAEIILGNTYHLYLRPGLEVIEAALYGVLTSRLRGSSAVRGATGHTSEILEALSWAVAAIDGYPLTKFLDVKLAADIEEARNAHGIEEDS